MTHVVINPTWRCQLRCAYCWLPHVPIKRAGPEYTAQAWGQALIGALPRGSLVDISGGEPLLYPQLPELLVILGALGHQWAMTTNGLHTEAVERMCRLRPAGGVVIHLSDHAGNAAALSNAERLQAAGYRLHVNRVEHTAAGEHLPGGDLLPYQDWAGGEALDGMTRECSAGEGHWFADPHGEVWRCSVWMQTGRPSMGNLFAGTFKPSKGLLPCDSGCSSCYRDTPEAWHIAMRAKPCEC